MVRIFSYIFFLNILFLQAFSSVIDSFEKAKKVAKLYNKPIICFFDDKLSEKQRGEIAREYFSHPSIYQPFSSSHIFTHAPKGERGTSGFMLLSKSGKLLANINTYNNFCSLAERISKETFFDKSIK